MCLARFCIYICSSLWPAIGRIFRRTQSNTRVSPPPSCGPHGHDAAACSTKQTKLTLCSEGNVNVSILRVLFTILKIPLSWQIVYKNNIFMQLKDFGEIIKYFMTMWTMELLFFLWMFTRYPAFLDFSHRLSSENIFIFFFSILISYIFLLVRYFKRKL